MTTVETARGPVATAELGPTLMHEHIVTRSPGVHEHFLPTAKRVDVLARLCAEGYAARMVLSHDANCWADMVSEDDKRRTRPLWHYNHISDDILPALRAAGVTEDQLDQMLVRNPRAIFEARKKGRA